MKFDGFLIMKIILGYVILLAQAIKVMLTYNNTKVEERDRYHRNTYLFLLCEAFQMVAIVLFLLLLSYEVHKAIIHMMSSAASAASAAVNDSFNLQYSSPIHSN